MVMMKTKRRKRRVKTRKRAAAPAPAPVPQPVPAPAPAMVFSSVLLTPEEERDLLTGFWECKMELVRVLIREFPRLRAHRPPLEPWPMAQFIREFCEEETHKNTAVRRLVDRYVTYKHRLASANIRLAAHVAKRFRHHSLSYSDLLQEAVCGLMQAIDRF